MVSPLRDHTSIGNFACCIIVNRISRTRETHCVFEAGSEPLQYLLRFSDYIQ